MAWNIKICDEFWSQIITIKNRLRVLINFDEWFPDRVIGCSTALSLFSDTDSMSAVISTIY